jgi:hypothetical protein
MKKADVALGAGHPPGFEDWNVPLLRGHGRQLRRAATRASIRQGPNGGLVVWKKNASLQRQPGLSPLKIAILYVRATHPREVAEPRIASTGSMNGQCPAEKLLRRHGTNHA